MRKGLMVLLALVLSVSFAFGQGHRTGDSAILFEFDGLSFMNVWEYAGGLGYKMNMGDLGVRAALIFGSQSIEDIHQDPNFGDKESDLELGLDVSLLYALSDGPVAPYVGVGFGFDFAKYKYTEAHDSDETGRPRDHPGQAR